VVSREFVETSHFVYMVCCRNGSLYVGYTTNVERRVAQHNSGRGARYTRANRPVVLVGTWQFATKSEALRAERELKGLSHEQKRRLAEAHNELAGGNY
jgi:putative endonuclease